MKKMDTQIQIPTNYAKEPTIPQEQPERRNPANNHLEFHGDVTRHGQPKCTRGTQEIPRQQK
jgi:hypothetical protein